MTVSAPPATPSHFSVGERGPASGGFPAHVARWLGRPDRRDPSHPWLFGDAWVAVVVLAMALASDYKVRLRDVTSSISGRPDVFVLLELTIYALVAVYVFDQFGRPPRVRRISRLLTAMWAFTAIMVISVTYTMYPFLAVSRAMQFTVCAVTAHAIARNATRRQLHLLGHAFLVVVTLSVGLGLAHKSEQTVLHANRFTWLELHPILAGVYCAIAFTLSVAYLTSSRRPRYADPRAAASGVPVNGARWPRLVYLVPLAVTGWALLATETRGATAGALVGSVLVVWLRASGKRRVDLLVGFTLAGVFAAVLASGAIASFVSRGETTQQLATLNSRTELWTLAFQKLRDRPMFGYGLGGTRGLFLDTIGLGGGHNAFVNVLVDQGVVGLLGFVVLLAAVLVTGVRVYRSAARRALPGVRSDAALVLGLFAFLLTNSITVEGLGAPANVSSVLLFALIGWLGLLSRSALAAAPATAPVAGEPVPLGAATVSD